MGEESADTAEVAWECELLADELSWRFEDLASLRAAYWSPSGRSPFPPVELPTPVVAAVRVAPVTKETADLIDGVLNVLTLPRIEAALGAPGADGDADEIGRFAGDLVGAYGAMLEWSLRLRSCWGPGSITDVCRLTSEILRHPIRQFEEFLQNAVDSLEAIVAHARSSVVGEMPTLKLTLDDFGVDDSDVAPAVVAANALLLESDLGVESADQVREHRQIADELNRSARPAVPGRSQPGDLTPPGQADLG